MNLKDEKNLVYFLKYQKNVCKDYIRFVKDLMSTDYKKAANLIYWLRSYLGFLKSEDKFKPELNIRYRRGQVVYVDFGFRIGSELGGAHYAIVLDVKNNKGAASVTVVPLNSDKGVHSKREQIYGVYLGDALLSLLHDRASAKMTEATNILKEIIKQQQFTDHEKERAAKIRKNINEAKKIAEYATKKMKQGSIANCGQVTTISKMRIIHPKKKDDILNGIILPDHMLAAIENKIKILYFP